MDPTTSDSESESACRRLIGREFTPRELPSLIEAIPAGKGYTTRRFLGDDAQVFIDVLDEALNWADLPSPTQKKGLKLLYRTCGRHALLPRSLNISVCYDRAGAAVYRGGFADVWKGEHYGRDVAIKVIRTYTNVDLQKIIGRFCKEVVVWKTLQHPNVLPLIGVTVSENQFAMVSDWMANGNINEFVRARPDANRLELLGDVTRGLIYIHSRGMVHGDIKGRNILIDQTGHPRLADFGLLTIISEPANPVSSNSYTEGGTARWMSPELIAPQDFGFENRRPTKPSDCYALGMVIYETIGGNIPFHEYADLEVLLKVQRGGRPSRGVRFTNSLWKLLEQCWAPRPNNRPSIEYIRLCLETFSNSPGPPNPGVDEGMDKDGGDWNSTDSSSDIPNSETHPDGLGHETAGPDFPIPRVDSNNGGTHQASPTAPGGNGATRRPDFGTQNPDSGQHQPPNIQDSGTTIMGHAADAVHGLLRLVPLVVLNCWGLSTHSLDNVDGCASNPQVNTVVSQEITGQIYGRLVENTPRHVLDPQKELPPIPEQSCCHESLPELTVQPRLDPDTGFDGSRDPTTNHPNSHLEPGPPHNVPSHSEAQATLIHHSDIAWAPSKVVPQPHALIHKQGTPGTKMSQIPTVVVDSHGVGTLAPRSHPDGCPSNDFFGSFLENISSLVPPQDAALPSQKNGVCIPQRKYTRDAGHGLPTNQNLTVFVREDGSYLPVTAALKEDYTGLVGRDLPVFSGAGYTVTIQFEWPGYPPQDFQLRTYDLTIPPKRINLFKLATEAGKIVREFIERMQVLEVAPEHTKWKVGPDGIQVKDLRLAALEQVSSGSWQIRLFYKP